MKMSDEKKKGPNLGGSDSDNEKSEGGGPSLGPSTDNQLPSKGPKLSSSPSGGPTLGNNGNRDGSSLTSTPSGGPSLGSPNKTDTSSDPSTDTKSSKSKKKQKRTTVNVHELVRRWGVRRRRVRDSLQTMMLSEIKSMVEMTPVNILFRKNIREMMEGNLEYFENIMKSIDAGEDEISQLLMKDDPEARASKVTFQNLSKYIQEQIDLFKEDKPIITDYIDQDLKRFRDARVEPRASWWVLWYTSLQMRELREKDGENLQTILDVMIKYKPVMRRVLGVYINFADQLMQHFEGFPERYSKVTMLHNPIKTGYNMAPWIKPRWGAHSQKEMKYESYIRYYARSFGTVPGNAPDFEDGPKDGYKKWIQDAFDGLEKQLRKSNLITAAARGDTLEGMLVGLQDQLKEALDKREYDDDGKLINQPQGGEGALKFLKWLFETALHRYDTVNIAIQDEQRMSLDMFDFIPDTVRWVNEYGERLVMDWLDPELEDTDKATSEL